ncbi:MAG: Sporulation kinase E [Pelotomaculum sp. PtaB.Bin104]|nr:MAG: Sporulation kinase E [Pelotomaculum sp. PtaB.Bin104]
MIGLMEGWSDLALDHLPVGLLIIDQEGCIRGINQVLTGLTGVKREQVTGLPFQEIYEVEQTGSNKLLQTLTSGKEFQHLEPEAVIPGIRTNGYTISTHSVRNKSGVIIGALALFTPVGRLQELENAVIKAEKLALLGQLAAEMVHEIRNPLTTINGFLQLLQKDLKGTTREEYINLMLTEMIRVNGLIKQFLQLSRPGYSKRKQFCLNKLMNDISMLVESEAMLRKLDIHLMTAPDIPPILGDNEQLKQAFLNIIKNGFDALSKGGKLFMQTSWNSHEKFVKVMIKDTGVGMDKQTIANMFYPFFTTKESGTGLGMLISKKIIDNHGGQIDVQSEPGKGTIVSVLLPVD